MKFSKKLAGFLILMIFLSINSNKIAHAQDSLLDSADTTQQGTDWDSLEQRDTKYQMYKVVTPQQYDAAMKQMQSLKGDKGKGKKGKKDKGPSEPAAPEIPASTSPLLRLPIDVTYGDTVIKEGFYLVDAIKKNEKFFIILKQGYTNVAEIEAKAENYSPPQNNDFEEPQLQDNPPPPPDNNNKKHNKNNSQDSQNDHFRRHSANNSQNYSSMRKVNSEMLNDGIKIDYYDRNIELEAILPFYKQE